MWNHEETYVTSGPMTAALISQVELEDIKDKELKWSHEENIWTDKNCFFGGFSKLRNGETTGITARELGHDCNLGIWIDIMPLDYCTTNEKLLSLKENYETYEQVWEAWEMAPPCG